MNWETLGQNLLIWAAQFGVKILGAVRPYTNNQHYWQVYFDTNRLVRNAFGEAGFPAPGQFVSLKNSNGGEVVAQTSASGSTH